jgi:GTPase SAR1 family protein
MYSNPPKEAIEDLVDGGVPADSAGSWIKVETIPVIGKVVVYIYAARVESLGDSTSESKIRNFVQKNSHGFLLVYCIASRSSFQKIVELHNFLTSLRGSDVPFYLIGLKSDLTESREVSFAEGKDLAQTIHALEFHEFSSRNENCQPATDIVVRVLRSAFDSQKAQEQQKTKASQQRKGFLQKLFSSSSSSEDKKKEAFVKVPEMSTRSGMPVANILILGSEGVGIRAFAARYFQNIFVER